MAQCSISEGIQKIHELIDEPGAPFLSSPQGQCCLVVAQKPAAERLLGLKNTGVPTLPRQWARGAVTLCKKAQILGSRAAGSPLWGGGVRRGQRLGSHPGKRRSGPRREIWRVVKVGHSSDAETQG